MPSCTPLTADQARLALQVCWGCLTPCHVAAFPSCHLATPQATAASCPSLQAALAVAVACLFAVLDPLWSHWGANGTCVDGRRGS